MNSLVKKIAASIAAIALVGSVASCADDSNAQLKSGSWEEVVEAASQEGQVSFYSGLADIQNTRLVEAFNKKYPDISVTTQRGAGELAPRVESEISAGTKGADVFALGDTTWFKSKGDKFLPTSGPAASSWNADGWANTNLAPIINATPNAMFVWNTDIFPDGFDDWEDLLDPAVKGKIGLRTDVTKSVAGYLDMMKSELGEDYLVQLGAQDPKVYSSVVPMTQAVASGEIGVTNASLPSTVFDLQKNGAPIKSFIPNPGYAFEFGMAALGNARHPNAAVVFTDFAMSLEGQTAINGDQFGASQGLSDVPGTLDLSGSTMMDSSKYTPEKIEAWNLKLAEYYGR